MANFRTDQFDNLPDNPDRIGAHRGPKVKGRGWITFAWALLAVVVLVVGGLYVLSIFDGQVKFEGLEGYEPILCQPRMLRKSYLEALNKHILAVKTACKRNKVDYVLLNTAQPLEMALQSFLQSRALKSIAR